MPDTSTSELPIDLPGAADAESPVSSGKGFSVHLVNFEGPFDLLLQLISKHKLDITEIALSQVTDEFIAHIKALGSEWDLDQTSEFLLIASTLLDLKAARLLPQGDVEDAEDLALLEARDLLFARLLQYRAFKQIAALIQQRMADEGRRFPRAVGVEPRFAELLPEVLLGVTPDQFAALAAAAMAPRNNIPEGVSLAHLHAPAVTVREQAAVIVDRLRRQRSTTFRTLVSDSPDTVTTVCRFLALLELFREAAVAFEQVTPLGELTIRWTGTDEGEIAVGDEFDEVVPPESAEGEAPEVTEDHIADFLATGEPVTEDDPPDPASTPEPGDANETVNQ
ncbi:chromosome segregation and condensation protein ScpA [Kribbella flavida DSM 17836]|uniref:Segregation and condensation protein A n=1 Tax=Kribbella flavida (strain DSM 17836 / JCM 10339 / NBRC 14399) TaxID=479435 RepID=D2Q3K7_KRIFD|nr:ScpA family protein [Kribbella flavida]ADB34130.1 chromosome segregation and condensation protein ScpA [Kribbella flavida DSM 17836]